MTDIHAMALKSAQRTLRENQLQGTVLASDVFSHVEGKFDLIISNPPFHDGIAPLARRRIVRARFELRPRTSKRFGRTPNLAHTRGHQVDKVSVLLYAKPAQESLIAQKHASTASRPNWKNLPPNSPPPKPRQTGGSRRALVRSAA